MPTLDIDSFQGLETLDRLLSSERPEEWRAGILYNDINGECPLTGLLNAVESEVSDDPIFHWHTENTPEQAEDINGSTDLFLNAAMTTPVAGGEAALTTVYAKVPESFAKEVTKNALIAFWSEDDGEFSVVAQCEAITLNGDNSKLSVRLLEADDNSADTDLTGATRIARVGSEFPEAGMPGDGVNYLPFHHYNYISKSRTPYEISDEAENTGNLRTGKLLPRRRKEAMRLHGIDIEKKMWFGVRRDPTTGENGKPIYHSGGIDWWTRENAPQNVFDYRKDTDFAGLAWEDGGEAWLDKVLEQVSDYGPAARTVFSGSGAVSGVNTVAKAHSNYQIMDNARVYGIKVKKFVNVHLDLDLIVHPLFRLEKTKRHRMYIFPIKNLRYRFLRNGDTEKYDVTPKGFDGRMEEWRTKCGPELHHPSQFAILDGVGQDNTLAT